MAATLGADVIYFSLVLSIILFIAGVYMKDQALAALSGVVLSFIGFNIIRTGFDGTSSTLIQVVGLVITIVGAYIFLRVFFDELVEMLNK